MPEAKRNRASRAASAVSVMFNENAVTSLLIGFTAFLFFFVVTLNFTIAAIKAHRNVHGVSDHNNGHAFDLGRKDRVGLMESKLRAAKNRGVEQGHLHVRRPLHPLQQRVCGSPAVDGYAHVVPKCLEDSPTNKWWTQWNAEGHKPSELQVHVIKEADVDGIAVGWGINNKKKDWSECAEQCRNHRPGPHVGGPFQRLPCNTWVYCEAEVCWEPDAHKHSKGDCWLKFTEGPANPEFNMKGAIAPDARRRHSNAPERAQWTAGVMLPPGVELLNGTFGPRYYW